jgi:hypothetical protein
MQIMTISKRVWALVAGASVLALGACDGVAVNRSDNMTYTGGLYSQSQAQGGTNAVMVRNGPFGGDAVLDALHQRYQSDQYRFGLGPTPNGWNGYTLVLGFGGAPVGNQNLCENPNLPLSPSSTGRTSLIGDYCYGTRLVSEASGWTGAVSGPADPRFQNLVGDVVAQLFAPRNQHGSGESSSGSVTH